MKNGNKRNWKHKEKKRRTNPTIPMIKAYAPSPRTTTNITMMFKQTYVKDWALPSKAAPKNVADLSLSTKKKLSIIPKQRRTQ